MSSKNNMLSKCKVLERTIALSNNLHKRATSTCLTSNLYPNITTELTYLKPKYFWTKLNNSSHLIQLLRNEHSGAKKLTDLSNNVNHEFDTSYNYIYASDNDTRCLLEKHMIVYEDFITEEEEQLLLNEIEPYMKRLKYEYDHWDNAIHGYRETERGKWTEKNSAIIQRVRDVAFTDAVSQLAYVHILDISKDGYIKPHIDAVRFCGDTIAGISLLSPCVMRLVHDKHKDQYGDVLLKERSLYVMSGQARYDFTHELLAEKESIFKNMVIPRDRRISVICRNEPAGNDI